MGKFRKFYTKDEVEFVRNNIDRLSIKEIAYKLNRTENSVRRCCITYRIPRKYRYNQSQDNYLHMTNRQLEIWALVAEGYSNKQITQKLVISESTVKTHLDAIYNNLSLYKNEIDNEHSAMRVRCTLEYIKAKQEGLL